MLAGAAVVIMGAGIATKIPGVLECLSRGMRARYELSVTGAVAGEVTELEFDPAVYAPEVPVELPRPQFLSIISSNVLATTMVRRSNGPVDGFVVESPTAGGHNAPPRGKMQLDDAGQPVYGEKDSVDLDRIRELGLPFWLAGGFASRERLEDALRSGAAGIQVGTAFALCEESGLDERYRRELIARALEGTATVFTDPNASPTGFPFKVAQLAGTLSDAETYAARKRVCDLGFLREAYRREDGTLGFRCPAEPESAWLKKGGDPAGTEGRRCLCNALVANIGHGQVRRDGSVEKALVTAGDGLTDIARFVPPGQTTYTAKDVLDALLG
jgi:nitronate monooxygenase